MAGQNMGLKVLVVMLLVISLALGGGGYFMLKQEKERSAKLEQDLNDAQRKYDSVQADLEVKITTITGLESNLDEAKMEIVGLNSKLSQEQATRKEALAKLEELKAELSAKAGIAKELEKKLADSEGTLREVDKRVKEMEAQLKSTETKKEELEKKVKSLEEKVSSVELGTIVVSPEAAGPGKKAEAKAAKAVKGLEGKILVVNKDYKFAVINLGTRDGVSAGSVFTVLHNNKNVGEVKVEKVHDTMSAAGFVTPDLKDKILEGDSVTQK
jgi:myosin heavy subunit